MMPIAVDACISQCTINLVLKYDALEKNELNLQWHLKDAVLGQPTTDALSETLPGGCLWLAPRANTQSKTSHITK